MFAKWWDNLKECCDLRLGIGAGCAVAWALVLAVSPIVSPESTLSAGEQSWRLAAVVAAGLGFACLSYLSTHRPAEPQEGTQTLPLMASGAVLAPLGALILRLSDTGPLALVAGAALGWSLTSLVASWMDSFVPLSLRKRVAGTVVAAFAGCLLYLVACLLPHPLSFAVSLPLAPLSFVLRYSLGTHRSAIAEGSSKEQALSDPSSDATKTPALGRELALASFVFGALFVLAGHAIPQLESDWMASALPGIANVTAFLLLETLITLYMVRRIRYENPRVASRPSTILVAVGFLLVPFCTPPLAIGCSAIAFAGFGSFLVYLWIVVGNFCQKWHVPGIGAASGAFLALFAGLIFGEIVSWTLLQLRNPGFDYLAVVSIVALFMLVVLMWSMSNGAQYAHETLEMGGRPYEQEADPHVPKRDGEKPDDEQVLQALAKHYGLSPREIEILTLLVKGRSIPYICDELFIAKSTAQTHVRHIYGKMEISGGRQELLDRFESEAASLAETPAA